MRGPAQLCPLERATLSDSTSIIFYLRFNIDKLGGPMA
jgi:hypothetical protein